MIVVEAISVQAGEFRLDDVSLRVPTGGYAVLMGKTGSGKTTILETIIGLRSVTRGRIWLDDRDVTHLKPAVRGIGYVPQDGALFSKMTVEDQLGLSLVIRHVPAAAIRQRVRELADLLGISHLLHRKPRGLSGGERQRVALGRALSFRPRILCLDEPLSALDDETRRQMCDLLASIRAKTGVTTLHITHNLAEAQILADCLFRLENGRIETLELAGADPAHPRHQATGLDPRQRAPDMAPVYPVARSHRLGKSQAALRRLCPQQTLSPQPLAGMLKGEEILGWIGGCTMPQLRLTSLIDYRGLRVCGSSWPQDGRCRPGAWMPPARRRRVPRRNKPTIKLAG